MNTLTHHTTILATAIVALSSIARAEDAKPQSPELRVLQRYVGSWQETVTIKPAPGSSQPPTIMTAATTRRWILDGHMIENKGTWSPLKKSFLHLMTYDAKRKEYRQWYFDKDSRVPQEFRGKWNAATKTLTFTGTIGDGTQTTSQQHFVDKDTFTWKLVAKDQTGKVVLDIEAKVVRTKKK